MYCAIVVPYRVRVVIPDTEMWEQEQVRPDFVLQNMVGATICGQPPVRYHRREVRRLCRLLPSRYQ